MEITIDVDRDEFPDEMYRQIQEDEDIDFDDFTYLAAMCEEIRRKDGTMDDVLKEFFDNTKYNPMNYAITESTLDQPQQLIKTPAGDFLLDECELESK